MTREFTDFHEAWHWLHEHPAFFAKGTMGATYPSSMFDEALDIVVSKVDPVTRKIEDDKSRNTHTEVWLECGGVENPTENAVANGQVGEEDIKWGHTTHDYELDCGGDTFEEAVLALANLVVKHYGDHPPLLEQIAQAADGD